MSSDNGERRRRDRAEVTTAMAVVDRTNYRALLESVMNPRHSQHQRFLQFLASRTVRRGLEEVYREFASSDHGSDITSDAAHKDVPAGYLRVTDCMVKDYERWGYEASTREIVVNGVSKVVNLVLVVSENQEEFVRRTTKGLEVYPKPCHQE